MSEQQDSEASRDSELDDIVAEFLEAEREGRALDRAELLSQYPHLADELKSFFAQHDELEEIAEPLRAPRGTPPTLSPQRSLERSVVSPTSRAGSSALPTEERDGRAVASARGAGGCSAGSS